MNMRWLLLPFSLVYGLAVFLRNLFYDIGIFKENKFNIPIIGVGNLTTGGSGKTPHIEYLLRLFFGNNNVSVLSRGYGRKTQGFLYVETTSGADDVGDEPLQLKNKFKEITVAVCEERKIGIEKVLNDAPQTSLVLLDDAFQHRAVKQSLSVLLLDYSKILSTDLLLPAGNLREPFSSRKRADIIVVSKTPFNSDAATQTKIIQKIQPERNQHLFFSGIEYGQPVSVFNSDVFNHGKSCNVLLVTGIADSSLIEKYVEQSFTLSQHLKFSDHHIFSDSEISNIKELFSNIATQEKIILTTEKDAMRLKASEALKNLPQFYLPIEVKFHGKDEAEFNKLILEHVRKN